MGSAGDGAVWGLTFIYYSKMHGHSNIKYDIICFE